MNIFSLPNGFYFSLEVLVFRLKAVECISEKKHKQLITTTKFLAVLSFYTDT